jgi:hypothetical protein
MTIIKNHFEVFLVTSKKWGNGFIESKVGLYSIKASSHIYSISYKCASKQAMKMWFSVGIKAKASDFDFQSCLLCANPIWLIFHFLSILTLLISKAMLRLFTD